MSYSRITSTQDFLRFKQQLNKDVTNLEKIPSQFHALAARLRNGTEDVNHEMTNLIESSKELSKKTSDNLRIFMDPEIEKYVTNRAQKKQDNMIIKNKITHALQEITNAEKHLIQTHREKMHQYNASHQLVNFDDDAQNASSSFSTQTPQQRQAEIDEQLRLTQRDETMKSIERDIENVQMIFKELNTLVHEQAEHVDNIEHYIDAADNEVEAGIVQLDEAAKHAASARKKKLCLTLFGIALLLTLILIIWVSMR